MERYITCGTLIDGSGADPVPQAVIRLADGVIAEISAEEGVRPPAGAEVLDLSDSWVLPGLVDCHGHLGINMGTPASLLAEPPLIDVVWAVRNARQALRYGITTYRDLGERAGVDFLLKRSIDEGIIPGPRLLVSGEWLCITGGHGWRWGGEVDGVDGVRQAVRAREKAGSDLIKIMATGGIADEKGGPLAPAFTRDEVKAIVEEASRVGKKVAAHAYGGEGARVAIEAGVASIEHGTYLTEADLEQIAARGIFLVPTISWLETYLGKHGPPPDAPQWKLERIKEAYGRVGHLLENARRIGVRVALGQDTRHESLADEMAALTAGGYSAMEAIQAATKWGAELCGLEDQIGTIEVGKLADLIAVKRNPLSDLTALKQVATVVKRGVVQEV